MQAEQLFTLVFLHEVHGDCTFTHNFVVVSKHLGAEQLPHCKELLLQYVQYCVVQGTQFAFEEPFWRPLPALHCVQWLILFIQPTQLVGMQAWHKLLEFSLYPLSQSVHTK